MVSFAVMQKLSTLYGVLSEKRKPIISYTEPRKNENALRKNALPRSKQSKRRGRVNERNAVLPVCNQEAKRNPATSARAGKKVGYGLDREKTDFSVSDALNRIPHQKGVFYLKIGIFLRS